MDLWTFCYSLGFRECGFVFALGREGDTFLRRSFIYERARWTYVYMLFLWKIYSSSIILLGFIKY